jgi:hypothetical protein
MGSQDADLPVEVGARQTLDIIHRSTKEDNGKFWNIHVAGWETAPGPNQYDGKELPW